MALAKVVSFAILLVVVAAETSRAQGAFAADPRTRLRITAPSLASKPIVGTLLESTEASISVWSEPGRETLIPRTAITRVERSRGRHGNGAKGLLIGALAGATAVEVAYYVSMQPEGVRVQYAVFGGLLGAGLGAAAGAIVGSSITTERWAPVPLASLRVAVVPAPRGVGISVGSSW